jgi:hypothetical protein
VRGSKIFVLAAGLLLSAAVCAWLWHNWSGAIRADRFASPDRIIAGALQNPSDIVHFNGRYVTTELLNNRLATFRGHALRDLRRFDPAKVGQAFASPHFLATTPWHTLLVSNGWGSSIIEIRQLDGSGWTEFRGIGKKFNAPHGICVDRDGWIYVGDSLNSRLVRFRDMQGKDWQVFRDVDKRISYIRQLVCRDGAVWISNSYERREGLNPGKGANILRLDDFSSGRVVEVAAFPHGNITGIAPLSSRYLLVGLWGRHKRLGLADTRSGKVEVIQASRSRLGVPYGIYYDSVNDDVLVAYFGNLKDNGVHNRGGIAVFDF